MYFDQDQDTDHCQECRQSYVNLISINPMIGCVWCRFLAFLPAIPPFCFLGFGQSNSKQEYTSFLCDEEVKMLEKVDLLQRLDGFVFAKVAQDTYKKGL
jgi:hypothetical protein